MIVFSDIDGTLLTSQHRITPATAAKIRAVVQGGIPFILVSSRPPQGIFPLQRALGISSPIVCFGGGMVMDADGAVLQSAALPDGAAEEIRALAAEAFPEVCITGYTADHWLVHEPSDKWVAQEQDITGIVPAVCDTFPHTGMFKLMCMGEPEHIRALRDALSARYPRLTIHPSKDTYLEIMDKAALKSQAMRFLCARYGTPLKATAAFGDNYNDIDMLQAAGVSYAMGNAPDAVKQCAAHVTADNDHDGVKQALDSLFPQVL